MHTFDVFRYLNGLLLNHTKSEAVVFTTCQRMCPVTVKCCCLITLNYIVLTWSPHVFISTLSHTRTYTALRSDLLWCNVDCIIVYRFSSKRNPDKCIYNLLARYIITITVA